MANYVSKVINIALGEVGYIEKRSNKSLYYKKSNAGSNNYTKYNKDMLPYCSGSLTDYWCANFVSWCFMKAYGVKAGKSLMRGYENYVPDIYNNFRSVKMIYKKSHPKKGDIILFGRSSGHYEHVGLVYKVTDNYVYTVEGNTSSGAFNANGGAVCKKKYSKNSSWIRCYARPKYDTVPNLYPTIKKGSRGVSVLRLKKLLKAKKYKGFLMTNYFGNGCLKAVKSFQKKNKLVVDGIVGAKTWAKLKK